MNHPRNRKAILLLCGLLGFVTLGQYYLFYRREYVWDAALFITLALICLALLTRVPARDQPADQPAQRDRRRIGKRTLIAALALTLNWVAARSANTQPPPDHYTASSSLWLGSLLLFFAAFTLPWPIPLPRNVRMRGMRSFDWQRTIRTLSFEQVVVLGLLLVGLLLRIWDLGHIPANLNGDEGTQGLWAIRVLTGSLRNPFATGWFTVPTMSFFAQAASLRLFGQDVAGLRALSALIGTATLVFTYLLARRNFRRRVALFALAALTFNHYHIHFSRVGSNQIADPLFAALTLWLLTEGLRRTNQPTTHPPNQPTPYFLAAGLTMGLSWYGYFGSRVILLIVAAYLAVRASAERGFLRRHARSLALMALMALMAASPLLVFYTHQPENLSARFNQVNFFQWLSNELARPDHDSTFTLAVRQIWRSISGFNHTLDPTFWYRAQIPLLDFVSGIFFILGLATAIRQWRRGRPATRLVLLWFLLALTFGWVLTENPPSSMRMVINAPAVALLVALGLDQLLKLMCQVFGGRRAQWTRVGLALMAVAALLNVHYYFVVYTPTRVYGNPTAETGTVLARYLADRGDHPQVFFYGPPFMYYDFGTIGFIARDVPGVDVPHPDQTPFFETRVSGPTLFVLLRERLDELVAIQAQYQNGQLYEFYSEGDGRLMFVVYEVLP